MNNDLSLFLGQLARKPHQVVALAPSSAALARLMCAGLQPQCGPIAELGMGTGKITQAILDRGFEPSAITGFELNSEFCEVLKNRFPGVDVRNEPAQNVGKLPNGTLAAVISGLPLLSMPNSVQRDIVGGAFRALKSDGMFVQFTYGPVPPIAQDIREELNLSWTVSRRVWGNLPPARVYTFRKGIQKN